MEEIKLLKEKHKLQNSLEFTNKIDEHLKIVKGEEDKRAHRREEDELEIQTLTSKLKSLLEEIDHQSTILETKSSDLKKYKDELESLGLEVKKVEAEQMQLQLKKESLKQIKPNLKDQRMIDQGVRKYNLLKEITGIRWNFESLESITKGYVTNKKDYIHSFNFDSNSIDQELSNVMWKEIEKSTKTSEESKENQEKNQ